MRKVIVGFSRPIEWHVLSATIMLVERTNYSHVYVRTRSDKYDRDLIYQASGLAVNFVGLDFFLSKNTIVDEFDFDVSDETYVKLMQFCIDNAGKPYGSKQLVGMGIKKLGFENPFRDGKQTYVCSEMAAYIIKEFISGGIGTDLDDIDPRAVHEYLSSIKR